MLDYQACARLALYNQRRNFENVMSRGAASGWEKDARDTTSPQ